MDFSMIQIRDKEHQSLGIKELLQLCKDFPNDKELGKHLRRLTRENSKILLRELDEDDLHDWREGTIWQKRPTDLDEKDVADWENEGGMDYSGAFESDVKEPQ